MKKDRQCNGVPSYPIYPQYQPMNMGYPMPLMPGIPMQGYPTATMNNGVSSNTLEQQMSNLEQQINMLDKRITNLENMYNNSNSINYSNTKYNSSNYQMM